ncbi:MAG: hypothetical protein C4346_04005 [Chloroflexota bacterium]
MERQHKAGSFPNRHVIASGAGFEPCFLAVLGTGRSTIVRALRPALHLQSRMVFPEQYLIQSP